MGGSRLPSQARCVFHRDSVSRMTDVPPSQTTRWRAVVRVLRSPLDSLSCTLFPASCSLCGSLLPRLSFVPICDVCWTEFPLQAPPVCLRCGDALPALPRNRILRIVPRLPPGAAVVCPRRFLWRLPGPHARGHSRAQVRPPAPGIHRAGPYARRSHGATRRRSSRGDAGDSRAAASLRSTRSADSTSRVRSPRKRSNSCARAIRNGGSRSPRARSCASAPRKARPGSLRASAGRMCAEHSWFPIPQE